jgi:hypothetical protein
VTFPAETVIIWGEILDFFGDPICPKCKDSTRD